MTLYRLTAYAAPLLAGLLIPFFLARGGRRWREAGVAAASLLAILFLLAPLAGHSLGGCAGVALYVAALGLFFAGLCEATRSVGISPVGGQIACGVAVVVIAGAAFAADPFLAAAGSKEEYDTVVRRMSDASCLLVVGSLLGEDPSRWKRMYDISRLADYGVVRADVPRVCAMWAGAGAILLAAGALLTRWRSRSKPAAPLPPPAEPVR
jgi:hypothetical protein